jgi:hypothetical protein
MTKEVIVFSYKSGQPQEEVDSWYFDHHVEMTKRIPYLARYIGYRFLHLPKNDFFHKPQYHRMEELWWPDKRVYAEVERSHERMQMLNDFNDQNGVVQVSQSKRVVVEKEINILCPQMTQKSHITMNELNGIPHVKGIWPLNYHKSLNPEEADDWYISHHTRIAAQNINFLKYVTWSPAHDLSPNPGFLRFTEQWSRDWQTYLDGFQSPNGLRALNDNKMENGDWRIVTKSDFMEYPHVVGNLSIFV